MKDILVVPLKSIFLVYVSVLTLGSCLVTYAIVMYVGKVASGFFSQSNVVIMSID